MGVKDIWAKGALAKGLDALSLEMGGVSDKIGQSNDTGGTTTAGSLMAKANVAMGLLENVYSQNNKSRTKIKSGSYRNNFSGSYEEALNIIGEGILFFKTTGNTSGKVKIMVDNIETTFSNSIGYNLEGLCISCKKNIKVTVMATPGNDVSLYYIAQYQ